MPATQAQLKTIMQTALALLPQQDQATVAGSDRDTLKAAVDDIFAETGKTNMLTAASGVISGSVSNWTTAEAIAANAQSAATIAALQAFRAALTDHSPTVIPLAYVAACAAYKQFGLSES